MRFPADFIKRLTSRVGKIKRMFFFLFGFISTWKAEIPDDLVSIDQFLKKLTFKGSSSPIKCGQSTVISSLTRLTKTSTIKLTTSFSGEIRWVKFVNLMATKNWVLKRILTPTADDLGRKFSRLFPMVDIYLSKFYTRRLRPSRGPTRHCLYSFIRQKR